MADIEMVELVETRQEYLRTHWCQFRQWAEAQYAQRGRGGFVINLDEPAQDLPTQPRYMTAEDLKKWKPEAWPWSLRVDQYNPEREAVFFMCSFERGQGQPIILGDQGHDEALPPIADDRPDSRRAKDFDQLLDILDDISSRGEERLNPQERVVWDAMTLVWEVENGGFKQFILNNPKRWQRTGQALRTLGATEVLAVFEEVESFFPDGRPELSYEQAFPVAAGSNEDQHFLEDQDQRFYKVSDELQPKIWSWWVKTMPER